MLSSSKIALVCASMAFTVPACTLVLGDFDPASTSAGTGGGAGPSTTGGMGGMGGMVSTSVGHSSASSGGGAGGTTPNSSVAASGSAGGDNPAGGGGTISGTSGTGLTCNPPCAQSPFPCKQNACVAGVCEPQDAMNGTVCAGGSCVGGSCIQSSTTAGASASATSGSGASTSSTSGSGGASTSSTSGSGGASTSSSSASSGGGCSQPSDCTAALPQCKVPTCISSTCGMQNEIAGTNSTGQTSGDCKVLVCDGNGNVVSMPADDPPASASDCSMGYCSGSTPLQMPLVKNTACSSNGGKVCDGAGACVECTTSTQCGVGMCTNHKCGPIQLCGNGTKDGDETGVDCGGDFCPPCGLGGGCGINADCAPPLQCMQGVCEP